MLPKRIILVAVVAGLLCGVVGLVLTIQQRLARCAYVPLLAEELLPNANLAIAGDTSALPRGWSAAAPGVQLGSFAVDGDGRALQLMGIANYIQTPPVPVRSGQSYCFTGLAITDSQQGSTSRLRVAFQWLDAQGQPLERDVSPWQTAVLWQPEAPPESWSRIAAAFRAPPAASTLLVSLHPSSDDRIYVDALHVRRGSTPAAATRQPTPAPAAELAPVILPWPEGQRAALSFSFDWETAMGGLVHSRSVDDPHVDQDPVQRGLRMREGITTTLDIFQPYGVRGTFFATGYNFLLSNTTRVQFMDNPTYQWASRKNRWLSDRWQQTPWFAPDPYGTVQSHPAWYFGDLVPTLQQAGQDIQSHTFSHFYGGFVGPDDWRADFAAWDAVAAPHGVPSAQVLAFPWSSSGGMSDANWRVLQQEGIQAVTRLSHQSQYNLFPRDERGLAREPRCRPVPGHEQILACPDFYLTPASVERATAQIDLALQAGGMIDIWSHSEEVVTPEQRAAWQRVVRYAATRPGLWVAPLHEIAAWQQAREAVTLEVQAVPAHGEPSESAPLTFRIHNGSSRSLEGLTLRLPFEARRVLLDDGQEYAARDTRLLVLDMRAGQTLEVQAWPAM